MQDRRPDGPGRNDEGSHLVNGATRGERIAEELRHALKGDAWHGPALLESLAGVSAEEALQRPIPTAQHSRHGSPTLRESASLPPLFFPFWLE